MVARACITALMVVVCVALVGCSSSSDTPTTSTTEAPVTTLPSSTTQAPPETTSTTLAPITQIMPPEYRIVERIPTEGNGDEVVVLLDPDSYDSLTDIDLYDLIAEVVELFPPVSLVHVVDDPAAANVVADPEGSEDLPEGVTTHYLARLEDGFRIIYLGPFASSGTAVLGS